MAPLPQVAAVIYSVPPRKRCPGRLPPHPAHSYPTPHARIPPRTLASVPCTLVSHPAHSYPHPARPYPTPHARLHTPQARIPPCTLVSHPTCSYPTPHACIPRCTLASEPRLLASMLARSPVPVVLGDERRGWLCPRCPPSLGPSAPMTFGEWPVAQPSWGPPTPHPSPPHKPHQPQWDPSSA